MTTAGGQEDIPVKRKPGRLREPAGRGPRRGRPGYSTETRPGHRLQGERGGAKLGPRHDSARVQRGGGRGRRDGVRVRRQRP